MKLTPAQLQAVAVQDAARDTCVVAGPGSGKTTVLVEYFANLVESGVDPLRILAVTFTDKAANNMRERLAARFRQNAWIRASLERAYISTVHGFCARLLKENAIFAGLDPEFYVMDERESLRGQRLAVDEVLDQMLAAQPDRMRALMRGLAVTDAGAAVLSAYEAIRAAGVTFAELSSFSAPPAPDVAARMDEVRNLRPGDMRFDQLAHLHEAQDWLAGIAAARADGPGATLRAIGSFTCDLRKLKRGSRAYDLLKSLKDGFLEWEYRLITEHYAAERATLFELLARFDSRYRDHKRQSGGLDYDDLQEYAVRLLEERDGVRRRVQGQFDRVIMDEFQDTNGQQARLLTLLRPPDRFYAVGDINQSIYGFRHAEPDVFRAYRHAVASNGRRLVELVENFRSRPDILQVVAAVTDGVPGIEPRPLVPGLSFPDKPEPSVEVLAAPTPELEARWVAARIVELAGRLRLVDGPAAFRDFAVLVRNSEVLAEFTRAFEEFGIPYLVNRGKGFYETREVIDLMHLLRAVANPRDEISMAAVLRSPFVEVSDEALLRLKLPGNIGSALEELAPAALERFSPDDAAKLERFRGQLAGWRATRGYLPIDQLLLRAMDECGYECPSGPRGAANIEKFLAQARAAGVRQTLSGFVDEIELLRESEPREPDAPPEDSANAVKIMTVHAAKGLEFPVVFLAALHKGVDSKPGGICFSPRIGLGIEWRHPVGGKGRSDSFRHAIKEELKRREEEESHRLLYVAMTRAEEHLVLSLVTNAKKPQNWAAVVLQALGLDLEKARDETVMVGVPGGGRVAVRLRCVDAAPPPPASHDRAETAPPVQFLDGPLLTGQHDSQADVTGIAMFADCPRRYYLSRYLGFDAAGPHGAGGRYSGTGLSAVDFGRQVHALLAGSIVEPADPNAQRLAEGFRRSALGKRAGAATAIEREFDFLMEMEDIVLRGQIDLWFEDRGKTVLVDYKTDRVDLHETQARAERYALQLRLYALALERLTGRAPDEAYICFLRPNAAVPVDLRPSLFDSPEAAVREFREAQEQQHFPLREGEHCQACPHFGGMCPAG